MKLFILLVLSIFCRQAGALEGRELDCDDQKVFKAVDLALRVFNDRQEGNQFSLLQITEARETDGLGTNLQVKYKLKETICPVGEGTWQECEFKRAPESGFCTAHVHQDDVYSGVSQTCTILRAPESVLTSTAICLGCWYPMPNNSLSLLPIVRFTIRDFNNGSDYPYLFEVGEISQAQQQVVSGMNYKFVYSIKETNCSKAEHLELIPTCKPIPGGRLGECEVSAYINASGVLVHATQDCKYTDHFPLHCFGCEQPISSNDPDLRNALEIAIEKFNHQSGDNAYYKLKEITRATTQLVAGINYRIACTLVKTNCTLEQHKQHQQCEPARPRKLHTCRISIYVVPWRNLTYPKITCTKFVQPVPGSMTDIDHMAIAASNQRYIAGLTPFRQSRHAEPRRVKHGHKKQKHRSSEEDKRDQEETFLEAGTENLDPPINIPREEDPTENTNEPPVVFPDLPSPGDTMGSHDSPLFDALPDLPEPTCPGKLWEPLKVPTTPTDERVLPTHRPLEDFDLLDAFPVQN